MIYDTNACGKDVDRALSLFLFSYLTKHSFNIVVDGVTNDEFVTFDTDTFII